jgi:WD40 repeat protein
MYKVCAFFARTGNCRSGDNCQFQHDLVGIQFQQRAHEGGIKSMGMIEGPRLITGGNDSTVKVWNLSTECSNEMTKATKGPVPEIQVNGTTIMWSVDEPLEGDGPGVPVGVTYLFDAASGNTLPLTRAADTPYTHPQEIRSIQVVVNEGVLYVVTGGGEGIILVWRFDAATSTFVQLSRCEGHTRAVMALIMHDKFIWSGSADRTLRVWDITNGALVGSIAAAPGNPNGHSDIVSCMDRIPALASDGEPYIVSGSVDQTVKLWKTDGSFIHSCSNGQSVTALKFCENLGSLQTIIVGLSDGSITIRSCVSMGILFNLEHTICNTKCIWAIIPLGHNCFATGGDDGQLLVWRVFQDQIPDTSA